MASQSSSTSFVPPSGSFTMGSISNSSSSSPLTPAAFNQMIYLGHSISVLNSVDNRIGTMSNQRLSLQAQSKANEKVRRDADRKTGLQSMTHTASYMAALQKRNEELTKLVEGLLAENGILRPLAAEFFKQSVSLLKQNEKLCAEKAQLIADKVKLAAEKQHLLEISKGFVFKMEAAALGTLATLNRQQ